MKPMFMFLLIIFSFFAKSQTVNNIYQLLATYDTSIYVRYDTIGASNILSTKLTFSSLMPEISKATDVFYFHKDNCDIDNYNYQNENVSGTEQRIIINYINDRCKITLLNWSNMSTSEQDVINKLREKVKEVIKIKLNNK